MLDRKKVAESVRVLARDHQGLVAKMMAAEYAEAHRLVSIELFALAVKIEKGGHVLAQRRNGGGK